MIFPFYIKYTNAIKANLNQADKEKSINYVKEFIAKKGVENIIIKNYNLSFKSNFFGGSQWGRNIMVPIEKGIFNIAENDKDISLSYEIFISRYLVIFAVFFSVIFGAFSKSIGVGLFCFFG